MVSGRVHGVPDAIVSWGERLPGDSRVFLVVCVKLGCTTSPLGFHARLRPDFAAYDNSGGGSCAAQRAIMGDPASITAQSVLLPTAFHCVQILPTTVGRHGAMAILVSDQRCVAAAV